MSDIDIVHCGNYEFFHKGKELPDDNEVSIIVKVCDEFNISKCDIIIKFTIVHIQVTREHNQTLSLFDNELIYAVDIFLTKKVDSYYNIYIDFGVKEGEIYSTYQRLVIIDCSYFNLEESLRYLINNLANYIE